MRHFLCETTKTHVGLCPSLDWNTSLVAGERSLIAVADVCSFST